MTIPDYLALLEQQRAHHNWLALQEIIRGALDSHWPITCDRREEHRTARYVPIVCLLRDLRQKVGHFTLQVAP